MKKHPVDDLFKSRLSELEKTPSSAAWEKIKTRTKKERRLAGWVWYAAASIVITLVAGYIVWNSERSNIETIGKEKRLAVVSKPTNVAEEQKPEIVREVQVEVKENPVASSELAANVNRRPLKPSNNVKPKAEKQINAEGQNQTAEPQNLATNDALVKEEPIAELPILEKVSPKTEEVLAAKVTPTPVEPTRIVVVAVETNDLDEEKPKSSKFSKVFRQLKNARAGEPVDWEEVGFNPKSLVAKVDDRLRNGEEKVSEKYHNLKEKTKL
ncbi:hypothetical protein [Dyadobacter psychrophilus]|uniref:Uncharacterized protein n=1 Tax=Dyadobacter psychrophilus TaxID=651661 RepID=A0A1T5GMZ2_9BACT|nr:hypothetical protein [Dyadobacter psychrophilus]SKC09728.1 hypothetical protein SAMN05660293_04147 [Dyadobacter psychrophilus]